MALPTRAMSILSCWFWCFRVDAVRRQGIHHWQQWQWCDLVCTSYFWNKSKLLEVTMLDTQLENLWESIESSIQKNIDLINSTILHQNPPDFASRHSRKSSSSLSTQLSAVTHSSPFRKIPQEIVREILSSCVLSVVDLTAFASDSSLWNLTRICSVWRDITLELPSL